MQTFCNNNLNIDSNTIAPCGLISNSMFNDSFFLLKSTSSNGDRNQIFLDTGETELPGAPFSYTSSFVNHALNGNIKKNDSSQSVRYLDEVKYAEH